MKCRSVCSLALFLSATLLFAGHAETLPETGNQQIKDYVGGHYQELLVHLHEGDAASLMSLLDQLHIPPEKRDETIKRLRALSEAYPTLAEFVERVPDFAHPVQAPATPAIPAVPVVSAMSESELVKQFESLKYKTRIHLSLLNGEEVEGMFSSFDKAGQAVWIIPQNSSSVFSKKRYALRNMKTVSPNPR